MAGVPSGPSTPRELLDLALANVAVQPRWSLVRRHFLAPVALCATESGYFIDYSMDEDGGTDGILVRGSSMWIAGDAWKSLLFGSRMILPAAVEDSGLRWLRCDTRFGRAKIGDEADPLMALEVICRWHRVSSAQPGVEPGGYLLTGDSWAIELIDDPRAGLVVSRIIEDGADLVVLELDGADVLPDPAPEDTQNLDDVMARKAPTRRLAGELKSGRPLDLDLHYDDDPDDPDFACVVSSYDIVEAVGLATAHEVEELLGADGHLGAGLSNDVIFDSPGDELIAFCRTREAGERLIAVLRSLS